MLSFKARHTEERGEGRTKGERKKKRKESRKEEGKAEYGRKLYAEVPFFRPHKHIGKFLDEILNNGFFYPVKN